MDSKSSPLTIPLAIVVAGGLIAAAIFLRGGTGMLSTVAPRQPVPVAPSADSSAITLRPVDDTRDHIRGNPDADIVFVEFSDTECPFCKRFHETMQRVIDEYGKSGKVAWVYRHYPIPQLHAKAQKEAEALECAAEQGGNAKFWEYTDRIFAITPSNDGLDASALPRVAAEIGLNETEFMNCLSSGREQARVQSDIEDGAAAGVNGTPHTVAVLQKPLGAGSKKDVLLIMEPFRDPYGQLPVTFSLDGLRIGLSGALPLDAIKKTIETLLK